VVVIENILLPLNESAFYAYYEKLIGLSFVILCSKYEQGGIKKIEGQEYFYFSNVKMIFFSSVPWIITNWTFSYRELERRELPSYLNSEKNLQNLSRVYVPILSKFSHYNFSFINYFLPVKCVYTFAENFVIVNQLLINSWMIWRILGFQQSRYHSPHVLSKYFIFVWLSISNVKKINSHWHVTMIFNFHTD